MVLLKIDYSFLFEESGYWIQILVYALFVYGRIKRWLQLKHVSKGFDWIGRAQILIMLIGLQLMVDGPQNLTVMRVLIYGSAFIMDEFSSWYYNRLNVPIEVLQNVKAFEPGEMLFMPWRRVMEYLLEEPDESLPFWQRKNFQRGTIWFVVSLALVFGFYRVMLAYTVGIQDGIQIAVAEFQAKQKEINQVTESQANKLATALTKKTTADSLRNVRDSLERKKILDVTVAAKAQLDKNTKFLTKPTVVVRGPAINVTAPAPRTSLPSTYPALTPDRVQAPPPPPPGRKGNRKYSSVDYEDVWYEPDTLQLASDKRIK